MEFDLLESDMSNESDGYQDYLIEVNTYCITPKIYDFATTYVKYINDKINQPNDNIFIDKYFSYKKNNKLIYYQSLVKNNDMYFLLESIIKFLSNKYHLPQDYISEIKTIFQNKSIEQIFKIFLNKMILTNQNEDIDDTNYDYLYTF